MAEREIKKNRPTTKRERLDVRVTAEQKALVQHAADLHGRSLSDFVLTSVQRAAEETIRSHELLSLSARESRDFVASLLAPPAPSDRLRTAAAHYEQLVEER